eukprot:3287622-Pyramimonas_sp.AAC.1
MQQTHALDDVESIDVRTSSVALPNFELSTENRQDCQDDSNDTNRFTDLARVADRVQSPRCHR